MTEARPGILLVDDEPNIIRALKPALEASGFDVAAAETGGGAMSLLASEAFDAILLDLGLPDMDGKIVIKRVREWSEVPIVVLSARDNEPEKIEALDLGADDYVSKPFATGELMARLRAALRGRERRFSSRSSFQAGSLWIDFSLRLVKVDGEEVRLTPREYEFLRVLARHAGRVVTHGQLIAAVWNGDADAQSVRVLAAQVRQKLERDPSRPRLIATEQGLGYRLAPEDESGAA